MSNSSTIEQRLERVEQAVRDLQRIVGKRRPDPNWISKMSGCMAEYPEFDEVLRLGREYREADRPREGNSP